MLPEEIRRALGDVALDATEVRFGAALGASFGETHVVRAGGQWRLFTRVSFMDPFREVALSQTVAPRVVTEGFRQKLSFALAEGGEGVLDVGILDQERAGTLARDWLRAPDAAPEEPAPVSAPRPRPLFAEPAAMSLAPLQPLQPPPPASPPTSSEVAGLRQKLVDGLAARVEAPSPPAEPSWAEQVPERPRDAPEYLPSIPQRYRGPPREPYVPIEKKPAGPLFEPWQLVLLALATLALTFMVISRLRGHR